jgi:type IX secretion system PorP/SprF family membrane protein
MFKRLLCCCYFALGCFLTASGQQLPQSSLSSLNPFLVNPAFSGINDYTDVRMGHRRQWVGFDDAPVTTSLTANLPLGAGEKVSNRVNSPRYSSRSAAPVSAPEGTIRWGAGAQLVADQTGMTERTTGLFTGAVHFSLANDWQLSAGIGAGLLQYTLRFDKIHTANPDPILVDWKVAFWRPFFSVGTVLQHKNFMAGLSVLSPNSTRINYKIGSQEVDNKIVPHFYGTALYRISLDNDWAVLPQVWVKAAGKSTVSLDYQVRVQYADRFWGGVLHRSQESLGFQLGLGLTPLVSVGYAYEYPLSKISVSSSGSHEIMIGFRFNNRSRIYCPPLGW